MKIGRVLAIILTMCLLATVFTGCSGGTESTNTPGITNDVKATDSASTPGKIVKLTAIFSKHPLTQEFTKIQWLQDAEARAGVDIEWEEVTADWPQKKGALLAAGDIPDIIAGNNSITDSEFAQFPGLFEDLSGLIEKHAPNVQAMFKAKPETKVIATQLDGKIYGIPKYQRYWPVTVTRQFINKKWLDTLGLQAPTNWDELYSVLLAFKEKDANGNGDLNDEIPMDFSPLGTVQFGFFQPTVLLGSMGITLSDSSPFGYFVEDGIVKNFVVDERYRKLVQFLGKCYSAGLINTEVFTQDYTKFQSVARGEGGCICCFITNLFRVGIINKRYSIRFREIISYGF